MTDPLGQSQVLPYLKGLSKQGYQFHLISFEKSDKYHRHKKHIQQLCKEDNIVWHPQYYSKKKGLLKTIRQTRRLNKVAFYLHEKHNFQIVHCRSYIAALSGLKLKRKLGIKFVFDMRGFWANERVDGRLWSLKNPVYNTVYKYFKRKEIQFFQESDYTISLTENGKNEILSWPTIDNNTKIKVIPCCVDTDKFNISKIDRSTIDNLKEKLGLETGDFILGYIGSIGTWYMLSEMLDYFKQLKTVRKNAKFLFVSGEDPKTIFKSAYEKSIEADDIKIASVLHSEVPQYISLFDTSIFFIRPTYSKKASSPTKQGEIMSMGIPLICNSGVGDTDEIVEKYSAGIVIKQFDLPTYQSNMIDPSAFDPDKIAEGANDYFSLQEGVNRYLSVYREING
ncbi:MAG: glycosyltransferase [Crocinitomicaceae bacterium]|nr:glycosyltransferase [Crocinitomicaceae bacterium]